MSEDDARDAARPSQPEDTFSIQFPSIIRGVFPTEGRFGLAYWAALWDSDKGTIRRWVQEYDIPHWKVGQTEMVIDAADFWAAVPRLQRSTQPPPQRGGARRRKKA